MVSLPLGTSDWERIVAKQPDVPVLNRYFEDSITNQVEGSALLARPTLKRWKQVGDGPIQGLYSQPGSFSDALFAASGGDLYRIDRDNSDTFIGTGLLPGSPQNFVRMAATAAIGDTPEMLYVADGFALWLYMENSFAFGTLTATGGIANGDVVRVGTVYYQWTTGSVNAGTPSGTLANPWLVLLSADPLLEMQAAINGSGNPGVTYTSGLTAHPLALARNANATILQVQARDAGAGGNSIVTTETGANIAWGAGTLTGGGGPTWGTVIMPDGLAAVAVAFIASYVVVVAASQDGFEGRFFWIEPGETFIRPLNFATAEQSPDPLHSCRVVGNQLLLFGTSTTEWWYPTGSLDAPFVRTQGQVFDRGIIEGTDVQINDNVYVTDRQGDVYAIAGGRQSIVSNPSIAERNREALKIWGI